MPHIDLKDNVKLFYKLTGEGNEVIALLNGVAMSTDHWELQVPALEKDFKILRHDFRGQGKSSLKPTGFSFETHADDFNALLNNLKIDRVHLVGVSYGAEVGMHFALKYPEKVKSLILGTAVSEVKPLLQGMVESWIEAAHTYNGKLFFKVMAPLVYSDTFYSLKKDWLDERAELFDRIATRDWFDAFVGLCENFLTLNITSELNKINVPTLVVSGKEDILKPVTYGEIIHDRIPGSRFEIVEKAGHALFLEKPKKFNDLILSFLKGLQI